MNRNNISTMHGVTIGEFMQLHYCINILFYSMSCTHFISVEEEIKVKKITCSNKEVILKN